MSAHTPGPWVGADENGVFNPCHAWVSYDDNGLDSESAAIWAGGKVIALVVDSSQTFGTDHDAIIEANARLIAAAPDLLAALQAVMGEYQYDYGLRCVEDVRAAIAKAIGVAP